MKKENKANANRFGNVASANTPKTPKTTYINTKFYVMRYKQCRESNMHIQYTTEQKICFSLQFRLESSERSTYDIGCD